MPRDMLCEGSGSALRNGEMRIAELIFPSPELGFESYEGAAELYGTTRHACGRNP